MSAKRIVAAREGWYTLDADRPHLLGTQCGSCETYYFPMHVGYCRNPTCDGEEFSEVELSHQGQIWSYTNAAYQPPPPYIAREPYVPFGIAAVELAKEKIIVLGQLATGVDVNDVSIGDKVELILESLYEDENNDYVVWKWLPIGTGAS